MVTASSLFSRRPVAFCMSRLLFMAVCGGFLSLLLVQAGVPLQLFPVAAICLGVLVVTTAGETALLIGGMAQARAWLPAAFVAGLSVSSVALLGLTALLGCTAQSAFLLWAALVGAAAWRARRHWQKAPSGLWLDTLAAVVLALVVAFFCRRIAAAYPTLLNSGTLSAWVDYFFHGSLIAGFGGPMAPIAGDIFLPGVPGVFYHYAPFLLPAALAPLSGLPGLGLATAVLLPLGLFTALSGLFALAAEMADRRVAFVALGAVVVLPDASHYGARIAFLDVDWMVFTSPGSGYAIGTAALAYLCLLVWLRGGERRTLVLATCLSVALILIRAHMFLLWAPAAAGTVILARLAPSWRAGAVAAAAILGLSATVLLVFGGFGEAALAWTSPRAYLDFLVTTGPPEFAGGLQQKAAGWVSLLGAILLLPATLGFWLAGLAVAAAWTVRKGRWTAADWLPLLLCVTYVLLALWAPRAFNGSLSEYKHRHFVLLYALVGVWTGVRLLELSGLAEWAARQRLMFAAPACLCLGVLALFLLRTVDPARPGATIVWAKDFYETKVTPGIPEAATYLRQRAARDDVMLVGGRGANDPLTGPAMQLVSLTGLPCYVARIDQLLTTRPPAVVEDVRQRMAVQAAVDHATDRATAFATLRRHGIRWYVMAAPDRPAWDEEGRGAAFRSGDILIYDTMSP